MIFSAFKDESSKQQKMSARSDRDKNDFKDEFESHPDLELVKSKTLQSPVFAF
jgi:hypothetical protein